MEMYQLEYFKSLAKNKSYTKASIEMNVSQPAISIAIAKFERELGVPLLEKTEKTIILTPFGESVLERTDRIIMEVENIHKEAEEYSEQSEEIICFGLPFTFCNYLIPLLKKDFSREHSNIHIDISQQGIERLEMELVLGTYDFTIMLSPERNKEIEFVQFRTAELYICFSEEHHFSAFDEITPEMLVKENLLISSKEVGVTKIIMAYLRKQNIEYSCGRERNGLYLPQDMLNLAEMNMGVAIVDGDFAASSNARIECCPMNPPLMVDLVLAWNKNKFMSKAKSIFKSFLLRNS